MIDLEDFKRRFVTAWGDRMTVGVPVKELRELVEDEIILALPYAPRHESCTARPSRDADGKTSPFAGLRGLMGGKH